MIVETIPGMLIARCEACRFASPLMSVQMRSTAGDMLRAAGWSVDGHATYCPHCSGLRYRGDLVARRRHSAA